jgi:hypothetical protein
MSVSMTIIVQLALVFGPVMVLLAVKKRTMHRSSRVAAAIALALVAAALGAFLTSQFGWQPLTRSSRATPLTPRAVFLTTGAGLILALSVLACARPNKVTPKRG